MSDWLFALLLKQEMSVALAFGLAAFLLHLVAYGWYALEIFKGRTRPNVASWLMWAFGAWVEFKTYDAIDSHWSTSALPFACLLGVVVILITTSFLQIRKMAKGTNNTIYEMPEMRDYFLVFADMSAYALYLVTGGAGWANFIAVSTSIVTFIPIWKTTLRNGHEHPGPWVTWCIAYSMMLGAVIAEGGDRMLVQSFYPVYYFILCLVVALLATEKVRNLMKN